MDSLKFVIEFCGFACVSLSFLLTSVDLLGCMDFRKVWYGFLWICTDSLSLLLSVVDLQRFPLAFYQILWICMDAWFSLKFFKDFCGFAWIPLRLLLSVVYLHGSP